MKYLQVLLLISLAVCYVKADENPKDIIKKVTEECKVEQSTTKDFDIFKHEANEDHTDKCIRSCVMKKMGVVDEKNRLLKDKTLEIIGKTFADDAKMKKYYEDFVKICGDMEVPDDPCEAAGAYNLCLVEKVK